MIELLVKKSLHLWPNTKGASAKLINLSENHTFLITSANGEKTILRVHRPGYHLISDIYSELNWMVALRANAKIKTPIPIAGNDGKQVQTLSLQDVLRSGGPKNDGPNDESPKGESSKGDRLRFAVMFVFEAGAEPDEGEDLRLPFEQLGILAAKCHSHAQDWTLPSDFSRLTWDKAGILDEGAHWGDWRKAPNISAQNFIALEEAEKTLRKRLDEYGSDRSRFGIIHADMRLANLLVDDGEVKLIDFDDCGFGWFAYDFAAAISFFEDSASIPALFTSWLAGYVQERKFSKADIEIVDSMVMLRRFALLAWVGSHAETELASGLAPDFAKISARIAQKYVNTGRLVS
ncbi:putative phosphotransferase [hydrothermal vent metagenome]|uniref:Putative phosphotransferase n=1 Tax=hydrothermal vent metagenome TaxID=652676 RepID=A0A3B0U019_9ZZZZ